MELNMNSKLIKTTYNEDYTSDDASLKVLRQLTGNQNNKLHNIIHPYTHKSKRYTLNNIPLNLI